MTRRFWIPVVTALLIVAVVTVLPKARFLMGGALVEAGYSLQDGIGDYDFHHSDEISPAEVWQEFLKQNDYASAVRSRFPRSTYHPVMALVACMDARIDTNELAGDTRRGYYVIRTAGSALAPKEADMLELAVRNGVKVILLTRHTDCAAEKVDADPELRKLYPALVSSMAERDQRVKELLARPVIAERITAGTLLVKQMVIDTRNDHLLDVAPAAVTMDAGHIETAPH